MYNSYTSVLVSTLVGRPSKTDITDVWKFADSNLDFRAENTTNMLGYLEVSDGLMFDFKQNYFFLL